MQSGEKLLEAIGAFEAGATLGWDGGTRTHYIRVKVWCVTITLHPTISLCERPAPGRPDEYIWGGRWDSNPRHPEPQSRALPTELHPPYRTG